MSRPRVSPVNSENKNKQVLLARRIEIEQQALMVNEQKIKALDERCKQLRKATDEKKQQLFELKQSIEQSKQAEEEDPIVAQLREHFKALKQEFGDQVFEEFEDDDIDVDSMTYEQLMELQEKIGKVSKGLSKKKLEQLSRVQFKLEEGASEQQSKCTICWDDIAEGNECIVFKCKHLFHQQCATSWLKLQKVCPNCKLEIL